MKNSLEFSIKCSNDPEKKTKTNKESRISNLNKSRKETEKLIKDVAKKHNLSNFQVWVLKQINEVNFDVKMMKSFYDKPKETLTMFIKELHPIIYQPKSSIDFKYYFDMCMEKVLGKSIEKEQWIDEFIENCTEEEAKECIDFND